MKVPDPVQLPSGNWNIRLRLNGQNISLTYSSDAECKQQAQLIKAEYLAGKRIIPKSNKTIGQLMDDYIDSRRKVRSPSTINGYTTIKKTRFQSYINKKPSAIKKWQTVIDDEVAAGKSPKTIKNSWALVAASLAYAGFNVPDVKLPTQTQNIRPWLDTNQIKIFISAVHGRSCEIPALLALHSLRRSEILGLKWDKINLKDNTIRIEETAVIGEGNKLTHKKTTKSKKSRRTVPIMIPQLKTALEAVPEKDRKGLVYKKTPNLMYEQINGICKASGLPEVGVHGLRHSFASLAFSSEVGLTEREVMEIGGWEDFATVHKIYEHLSAENRLKAENKLAEFFKNADENAHADESNQ